MATGHNRDPDLATGGSSFLDASANEGGSIRAGWTWCSVSVSLQGGATELGKFPEGYRVIPTIVMQGLVKFKKGGSPIFHQGLKAERR